MTVRVYTWEDEGAPVLIMTNPTGNTSFGLERLKQILMACLVTGYGDKEPAGWSVGHDVEGGFSLFNGDGYFAFTYEGVINWMGVYTLDDLLDGSTPIPAGPNRRTGWRTEAYPTNTPYHWSGVGTLLEHSRRFNPRWVVVADDKTVYMNLAGSSGAIPPSTPSSIGGYDRNALGFGRMFNAVGDPLGFVTGGYITAGYGTSGPWASDLGGSGWSLTHNPTTGGTDQGGTPYVSPLNHYYLSTNAGTFAASTPAISLVPLQLGWWGGNSGGSSLAVFRPAGRLRGVLSVYPINGLRWDAAFSLLANTTLQELWDQPMRPFELNGKQYVASGLWWGSYRELVLISTDEADWL